MYSAFIFCVITFQFQHYVFQNLVSGQQSWLEVDIIITWVEVEEVEVTVEQVEQEEERGEAQILNIK